MQGKKALLLTHKWFHWCWFSSVYSWPYSLHYIHKVWRCLGNKVTAKDVTLNRDWGYVTPDFWLKKRFETVYEVILTRFSQELILLFDLKKWKHLTFSIRPKAKMFFHFYLLILRLPYVLFWNAYSSLPNSFKVPILANNVAFQENTLFNILNK